MTTPAPSAAAARTPAASPRALLPGLLLLVAAGVAAGMVLGPYPLWPFDDAAAQVLWQLRAPRVLAALVVGAVLGLGGALLQGWFRNALVEPGLLGVSAGAALAAALVLLLAPAAGPWMLTGCAFAGAFATVWLLARMRDLLARDNGLVLAGIAINALVAASIGVLSSFAPAERLKSFSIWGLASFDAIEPLSLLPLAAAGGWMLVRVLPLGTALDALSLGSTAAGHLGFDVPALERRLLLALALGVGAATAAVGPLAFVGLLAPHLLRGLGVHGHARLLPLAALLGAGLTVWAELGARVLLAPRELPAGVLTQLAGALLFAQLLWRGRRNGAAGEAHP